MEQSTYGKEQYTAAPNRPQQFQIADMPQALAFIVPFLIAALLLVMTRNLPLALLAAIAGSLGIGLWLRWRRQD